MRKPSPTADGLVRPDGQQLQAPSNPLLMTAPATSSAPALLALIRRRPGRDTAGSP